VEHLLAQHLDEVLVSANPCRPFAGEPRHHQADFQIAGIIDRWTAVQLEVLLDAKIKGRQPDIHPLQRAQGGRHLTGSGLGNLHIEIGIINDEGPLGSILVALEEGEKEAHDAFFFFVLQEKRKVHGNEVPLRLGQIPGTIHIGHGDFSGQPGRIEGGQEDHGKHQEHAGNAGHGGIVESQLGKQGGVPQKPGAELGQDIADDRGNSRQGESLDNEQESDMHRGQPH